MSDERVLLPSTGAGTLSPWVIAVHYSIYLHAILVVAGLGSASSRQVRWSSALQGTSPSPAHSVCCASTHSLPKLMSCCEGIRKTGLHLLHEAAWRYETRKTLAGTTASSSTELSVDQHSPPVFVMVGFPPDAYPDNRDAPCLFGLCIFKCRNVKGKSKSKSKSSLWDPFNKKVIGN